MTTWPVASVAPTVSWQTYTNVDTTMYYITKGHGDNVHMTDRLVGTEEHDNVTDALIEACREMYRMNVLEFGNATVKKVGIHIMKPRTAHDNYEFKLLGGHCDCSAPPRLYVVKR